MHGDMNVEKEKDKYTLQDICSRYYLDTSFLKTAPNALEHIVCSLSSLPIVP